MSKSREKTRANKKEQRLNRRNEYGNSDPTPYKAVQQYNLNKRRATRSA